MGLGYKHYCGSGYRRLLVFKSCSVHRYLSGEGKCAFLFIVLTKKQIHFPGNGGRCSRIASCRSESPNPLTLLGIGKGLLMITKHILAFSFSLINCSHLLSHALCQAYSLAESRLVLSSTTSQIRSLPTYSR